MKIEFIGSDCAEALVTRGWLRRRAALVERSNGLHGGMGYDWRFSSTQRSCDYDLGSALERARKREIERAATEQEWIVVRVPAARKVLR